MSKHLKLDYVLERVDAKHSGSGYMAVCPGHDDSTPSLSITPREGTDECIVYCFAGCTFSHISASLDGLYEFHNLTSPTQIALNAIKPVSEAPIHEDTRTWWQEYTGIPAAIWEASGVTFKGPSVVFSWDSSKAQKLRIAGTKKIHWEPSGIAAPPLWPEFNGVNPHTVYITEGESDYGVLTVCGFPTHALTKGANMQNTAPIWKALSKRGVKNIVFALDHDQAGKKGTAGLTKDAHAAGLQVGTIDVSQLIDPLLGEKDLRDVWLRTMDAQAMRQRLQDSILWLGERKRGMESYTEFKNKDINAEHWLIQDILFEGSVQIIAAMPKMKKTWLQLDLLASIATGTPFLDYFETLQQGPVAYISGEGNAGGLRARLDKIMAHKGFPDGCQHMFLERSNLFVFDDEWFDYIMEELHDIRVKSGPLLCVAFDPISRMFPGGFDEYKTSEVSKIFTYIERIKAEHKCAISLCHHKAKGMADKKDSLGSQAFRAFVECSIYPLGDSADEAGWITAETEHRSAESQKFRYKMDLRNVNYVPTVELVTAKSGIGLNPTKKEA